MISRFQTILFAVLLVTSVVMGIVLWQLLERAHQRRLVAQDSAPTQAPEVAPAEQATLLVANDTDSSLRTQIQSLPLPQDQGSRARAILGKLLDLYAAPDSAHPIPGGAVSIAQVFLLPALDAENASNPAPTRKTESSEPTTRVIRLNQPGNPIPAPADNSPEPTGPELAVVNLTGAFVSAHPSGIETETLTVLSICGTLHANLPRVTQVRFLVDGQPRATLAGHADLTRTYIAAQAVPSESSQP